MFQPVKRFAKRIYDNPLFIDRIYKASTARTNSAVTELCDIQNNKNNSGLRRALSHTLALMPEEEKTDLKRLQDNIMKFFLPVSSSTMPSASAPQEGNTLRPAVNTEI